MSLKLLFLFVLKVCYGSCFTLHFQMVMFCYLSCFISHFPHFIFHFVFPNFQLFMIMCSGFVLHFSFFFIRYFISLNTFHVPCFNFHLHVKKCYLSLIMFHCSFFVSLLLHVSCFVFVFPF